MNIAIVKKVNEKLPYWVKKPFAKIIRDRLITNNTFLKTYSMLEEMDNMNADEKKSRQISLLKEVLIDAYNNSKYYNALFKEYGFDPDSVKRIEDIQVLPVLTKDILKTHFDEIVTTDDRDFYTVTTGGSTGEPTKILMDKEAIYKEWAFIYHYWAKFGYDYKTSKLATFRGVDMGNRISIINPLYAEIRLNPFILNNNNINEYIAKIKSYRADYIYGYPSAIYNFCRIARNKGIQLKGLFKGALFISENLYDFQETLIEEVLQCPMVIFYGQSERAVFAERYRDGYVFNLFYGVTELSEKGEPIVTGFINPKTPLIRYLVDDYVEPMDSGYKIMGHHETDVLYGANGEQVTFSSINFHDDTFENIASYQFVQDEIGECVLNIVPEISFNKERLRLIEERINKKLGNGFEVKAQIVDSIPVTSRGKHKMIVQNCCGGGYYNR